ncbi:SRPBCC family protein [Nitriliruptor alkaliphilus]|uniref:SRPBCC family protein n=1 Tax=Nitriliruptor alkaliphilus TaxID=427918 RepID=UPI000696FFF2|nr:SRPBCC family protein [Nitriliruptor alkaliphilus]
MGEKVSESTVIAAPVATVLDVITDLDAYPDWAEGILEAETLSRDDQGRPATARFRVDAKIAEVRYTLEYRYGDDEVSWTLIEGETISQLDGRYALTPDGDTTGVRYDLEADVDIPLPGFLKKRAAKQILEQGLEGLQRRAESRG